MGGSGGLVAPGHIFSAAAAADSASSGNIEIFPEICGTIIIFSIIMQFVLTGLTPRPSHYLYFPNILPPGEQPAVKHGRDVITAPAHSLVSQTMQPIPTMSSRFMAIHCVCYNLYSQSGSVLLMTDAGTQAGLCGYFAV